MNLQRETIYGERRKVLFGENMKENVIKMTKTVANDMVERFTGEDTYVEDWDFESLETNIDRVFGIKDFKFSKEDLETLDKEYIKLQLEEKVLALYEEREKEFGEEIYRELIMPVDTNIKLSSVILSEMNKERIRDFVLEMKNSEKLARFGLKPMNRLLFYGASGCGKTFLGKALCNHLGYTMLYVDIARALSQGNVAMNLTNVFKIANSGGDYMVFLEECDSIAWNRDSKDAEGGVIRRATNSLFQMMDQM
jgi:SpoVK/Ycf46/Vps4 family AAA+-type ATPase